MNKTEIENQLDAKNKRADELRDLRDETALESDALDLAVQNGDFKTAGKAANKRAELDAIARALAAVEAEALECRGQLDGLEADRLRGLDLARVAAIASNLQAAKDRRNSTLAQAAAALDASVESALDDWNLVYELTTELDQIRMRDGDLFRDAVAPELRDVRDAVFFGEIHALSAGENGVKIACDVAGRSRRAQMQTEVARKNLAA